MGRKTEITADGSQTIYSETYGQTYHSRFGAIAESMHVYINAGLDHFYRKTGKDHIRILEMGFGTGLNALLTCQYAKEHAVTVDYEAIELIPITTEEVTELNYGNVIEHTDNIFMALHKAAWDKTHLITPNFSIKKVQADMTIYSPHGQFDVIYYDAFSPDAQPELWSMDMIKKLYSLTAPEGIVVTYCCKGAVTRAFREAGYTVNKIPGPKGKREMLRAEKMILLIQ